MLHHFIKFLKDLAPYNGGMINIDGNKWLQLIKIKKNKVRFEKFSSTFKHKIMEYNTHQHVKINHCHSIMLISFLLTVI